METANLTLLPYHPAQLLALIEGVEQFERAIGHRAAEGMRDGITSSEVSPAWLEKLRAAREQDVWMHGFALLHRESNSVIGTIGFKGPPDDEGVVEIAYGVVPGFRERGLATEAAAAAVRFAGRDPRVKIVRAHTRPERNASTRVLAKCGFDRIGDYVDPEDGLVWRWERHVERDA